MPNRTMNKHWPNHIGDEVGRRRVDALREEAEGARRRTHQAAITDMLAILTSFRDRVSRLASTGVDCAPLLVSIEKLRADLDELKRIL